MKTIEIDGKSYLIDIEKAKEQGLLKEKDSKPHSWKEYEEAYKLESNNFYSSKIEDIESEIPFCSFATEDKAKAFCALGKLIQLRDAWWGEWRPDYTSCNNLYVIRTVKGDTILADCYSLSNHILVFPTQTMRDDFLNCFEGLIEQAKMFL